MKFARPAAILLLAAMLIPAAACSLFPQTRPTPTPTPTPTQIIAEPTYSADTITRQYEFSYDGRDWQWILEVPQSLYDYYLQRPRAPTEDYSIYVTHPEDDAYIDVVIGEIESAAAAAGYDERETVNFAVAFIQSLPYTTDNVTTPYDEYPRYPIETLVDNGGDCEDTSILMAAILNGLGYETVLVYLPEHMAVGVLGSEEFGGIYWPDENGSKFYHLETTGTGWEIGELPEEYAGESAILYDIVPVPILTQDWNAESQSNIMNLTITVENLGTETATDVYLYAAFDAGEGMVWNPEESERLDIEPDQSITITMQLDMPEGEHTRLIVQIVDNGYSVDKSYSEWFDA